MAEKLVCAVLQADLVWEDVPSNLVRFEKMINTLSSKVDLIVLPEMFSTGFTMNASKKAEPVEGPAFKWLQKMAAQRQAAITGSVIVEEEGKFFNRLYFVLPDGGYRQYDKRHTFTLAGEDKVYASGQEKLVLSYKGWKICPLICYDLRFPVWSRNTQDYDLLIYVANWPQAREVAWDSLLKARAIENMSYCIGVNRVGIDGNNHLYSGHSNTYDCLGKPLLQVREDEFTQEVVLERQELEQTRTKMKFLQDRDDFHLL